VCFLFDNGSLRAASTLNLRLVARALATVIGVEVHAVSLLHSSGVDPAALGDEPARLLEPALQNWLSSNPGGAAIALPFFFGPSAALTDYVPERLGALAVRFPEARVELARWLVDIDSADTRLAEALAENVRKTLRTAKLVNPKVVLVDHGSPQPAVAAVRDHLGRQLKTLLADEADAVGVASMERRAGSAYAFNEPLIATLLRTPPFEAGDVVVALQFLSPGRHAGAGGDIAEICEAARTERTGLRILVTDTLGPDPRVIAILAERYREAVGRLFATN
jgi:sirohydrochlorin ferrochelatase